MERAAYWRNGGGDEIFRPEHLLQIRIDDVPLDQIDIRNFYSAAVLYRGITPPQNASICQTEAKAILDRQPAVREKENEIADLVSMLETATGDERARILAQVSRLRRELSPLMKELRAAEFFYESCILSRPRPPPPVSVPDVLEIHPTIAKRRIENLGLRANMIGCFNKPTCSVSSQDPVAGTVVLRNSVVTCRSEDTTL